jgi:hypothetical protein
MSEQAGRYQLTPQVGGAVSPADCVAVLVRCTALADAALGPPPGVLRDGACPANPALPTPTRWRPRRSHPWALTWTPSGALI